MFSILQLVEITTSMEIAFRHSGLKGKDLFDHSHNPSHLTLYPDVLKINTTIVAEQKFEKMSIAHRGL